MSGYEEHARGGRGIGAFPAEWGIPPGRPYSEERAAWVKRKVLEHRRLTPAQAYRELAAGEVRRVNLARIAELKAKEGQR